MEVVRGGEGDGASSECQSTVSCTISCTCYYKFQRNVTENSVQSGVFLHGFHLRFCMCTQ